MGRTAKLQQRTPERMPAPAAPKVERKPSTITEDDVRLRAYEYYLQRGETPGDEVADWLRAERELHSN